MSSLSDERRLPVNPVNPVDTEIDATFLASDAVRYKLHSEKDVIRSNALYVLVYLAQYRYYSVKF